MSSKQRAKEGDVVAIPLGTGGWGVGVIARTNRRGRLVVFFFALRQNEIDQFKHLRDLSRLSTIAVAQVGDLRIRNGTWPIVSHIDPWDRDAWRPGNFLRYEQLTGRTYSVEYDDLDPSKVIRERLIAPGIAEHGPSDDLFGAAAAEGFFTRLLGAEPV